MFLLPPHHHTGVLHTLQYRPHPPDRPCVNNASATMFARRVCQQCRAAVRMTLKNHSLARHRRMPCAHILGDVLHDHDIMRVYT